MSGISDHLYYEMLKAMRGNNPIRDSIVRQEPVVRQWIEDSIDKGGVDLVGDLLEDLISMDDTYRGSRPVFNQLVEFAIELDENGIERGSAKFDAQVRGSADYGSLDTFYVQGDTIMPAPNPDRQPERIIEAEDLKPEQHPLRASWDSAVDRYKEAEASNDTFGMDSAQRMLDRLEKLITAEPAKPVLTPVPSPAEPAPLPENDHQARSDELGRRLDALPDEETPESRAELAAINAGLDQLNSEMDEDPSYDPYEADEDYG